MSTLKKRLLKHNGSRCRTWSYECSIKLDCVIDHITDNRLDTVGINMSVDSGYTLHHHPRNTGRKDGGVGVLINNQINVNS